MDEERHGRAAEASAMRACRPYARPRRHTAIPRRIGSSRAWSQFGDTPRGRRARPACTSLPLQGRRVGPGPHLRPSGAEVFRRAGRQPDFSCRRCDQVLVRDIPGALDHPRRHAVTPYDAQPMIARGVRPDVERVHDGHQQIEQDRVRRALGVVGIDATRADQAASDRREMGCSRSKSRRDSTISHAATAYITTVTRA